MRRVLAVSFVSALLSACGQNAAPTTPSPVPTAAQPPSTSTQPRGTLGTFELIFAADPACAELPVSVLRRRYTALLQDGGSVTTLAGARFVPAASPYPSWNVLYTRVSGETADVYFQDPPIWEALADDSYLVIFGHAHGRFLPDASVLPFWARFEYCAVRSPGGYPECAVPPLTCESEYHQLQLRRLPPM